MRSPRTLLLLATAGALLALQGAFVYEVASAGAFEGLTAVEGTVLGLAAAKSVGFFSWRALRDETVPATANALTAELVVFEGVALLYAATGDPFYHSVADQVFNSWLLGAAVFILPFAIFKALRSVHRGGSVAFALPGIVLISELQQGFISAAGGKAVLLPGALGFGGSLLQPGRAGSGFATYQATEPVTSLAFVVLFLSLLLYVALYSNARFRFGASATLLVLIAGAVATLVWVGGVYGLVRNLTLVLAPPTFVMTALWWWIGRAR